LPQNLQPAWRQSGTPKKPKIRNSVCYFLVKFGVLVFLPAGRLVGGGKIAFLDQTYNISCRFAKAANNGSK
jgi:hypothetical protein